MFCPYAIFLSSCAVTSILFTSLTTLEDIIFTLYIVLYSHWWWGSTSECSGKECSKPDRNVCRDRSPTKQARLQGAHFTRLLGGVLTLLLPPWLTLSCIGYGAPHLTYHIIHIVISPDVSRLSWYFGVAKNCPYDVPTHSSLPVCVCARDTRMGPASHPTWTCFIVVQIKKKVRER